MRKFICALLAVVFVMGSSSCQIGKKQGSSAFADDEIIARIGMKRADFVKKLNIDEKKDTVPQHDSTSDGARIKMKEPFSSFHHEFSTTYLFSPLVNLSGVEYRIDIEDRDESLGVLKELTNYFMNQYKFINEYVEAAPYHVPTEERITEFLKKDKEAQAERLRESTVSLKERWGVCDALPNYPKRSLAVEITYHYNKNEESNTKAASISVLYFSYITERKAEEVRGAFPNQEIIQNMGMQYADFMKQYNIDEANDLEPQTVTKTISKGITYNEFMLKKPQTYFKHDFRSMYEFVSAIGLWKVDYRIVIKDRDEGLAVLKEITDYYKNQYEDSTPSENQITEFLKQEKGFQEKTLSELPVSLKERWEIFEFMPSDSERRLDVGISYCYELNETSNVKEAIISVTYTYSHKYFDPLKELRTRTR